jgi:hypothetical protein
LRTGRSAQDAKTLATKTGVEKVSGKIDNVKVLLEHIGYNNMIHSFNSARVS